jgi:membrane protease YdiL (CAAX protease family)
VSARGIPPEHLALALPDGARTLLAFILLGGAILVHQVFSLRRLARMEPEEQGIVGELARKLMPQSGVERLAFVALAATVALCEEVIYRGFVFAVLQDATGGSLLAAALGSAALFSLAHIYQGVRGLASTFFIGVLFAGVRGATGSLAACIGAHLLVDLYAGLAAPRALQAGRAAGAAPGESAEAR